jgi:hypothetical protein
MKGERNTLTDLEKLFVEVIDQEGGAEFEDFFMTRSREGLFSPALVMWLMMCQRTQERRSLVGALEELVEGGAEEILGRNRHSKRVKRREISMNNGGLSRARSKLPLPLVITVAELVVQHLTKRHLAKDLRPENKIYIMDGTTIDLCSTPANKKKYLAVKNMHGEAHHGQLLCLFFHHLYSGIALTPHYGRCRGAKAASEQGLCKEMMQKLEKGSVLMGDRNFGVFSVAYEAQRCGHDVLLRLTSSRAKNVAGQLGSKNLEKEVIWRPGIGTIKAHPDISADAVVPGRFIQSTVKHKGCKPQVLYFFTTLSAPVAKILELYKQREKIEQDIRSIKHSLGMEMLYSRTPDMLE